MPSHRWNSEFSFHFLIVIKAKEILTHWKKPIEWKEYSDGIYVYCLCNSNMGKKSYDY